ncbi:hypothetical protein GLOIN_2v1472280 [Rhizophagus irregularis DAOM 181602=DAOM 197198]|uniref:Uncharacterized protein n=1 Tax=Rhizophagus irregularis (strain DAOM 181602 / DAOM 197198 / MUCL 43194) TaxID=747089 RepID=A0A2P4QPB7_RHIID|nr:hypothetical protein GLOIN_2v1472280 [Rhizophagus irregularis DAOM 181602=DAOM 197198]POG79501.1 hypothetical protein GLOIN_2v1472280 [Rhizophagus irregularis DAOM 181602=DAOM 197198]|eukprot:XP_025186367.1 hypothetical protein GLOIN_2v1472280 [Rhizophagus irregularis DAOM 181602=DAOM 197198]
MSAEIVFSIIILAIINIIFILDIIGCIFIFFRVSKIYALLNEKRMSPGIKFPFYLAITFHLELDKLDQSGNYNFSIYELKKLKSYISLFIILWALIITFHLLGFHKYKAFDISYAIAGICHVILFIVIEGFFFKPDSIVQQQQESQQINDPETGIISSVENRQERPPSETVSK